MKVIEMISQKKLERRIKELADQINKDYGDTPLRLIGVLKGSVFFLCELSKHLTMPVTMDFMKVSSYGNRMESSGTLAIDLDVSESLAGEQVLLVEDIVDTGITLQALKKLLLGRNPESLAVCVLLDKPSRRLCPVSAEYTGFVIEDKFVVGFGMDYAQRYRNLPYIGMIIEKE